MDGCVSYEISGSYEEVCSVISDLCQLSAEEKEIAEIIVQGVLLSQTNDYTASTPSNENAQAIFKTLPYTVRLDGISLQLLKAVVSSLVSAFVEQIYDGNFRNAFLVNVTCSVIEILSERGKFIEPENYDVFKCLVKLAAEKKRDENLSSIYYARIDYTALEGKLNQPRDIIKRTLWTLSEKGVIVIGNENTETEYYYFVF